jgi:hypothetical protein
MRFGMKKYLASSLYSQGQALMADERKPPARAP